MARSIDDFWKLLEEIQGSSTDLTEAVKSIAKNEKTVSETLFSNIIDQPAYNSQDYQRIRAFLRDWYAALRSLTSFQSNINDIYQLPNDQLDELFQSFGFNLSTSLRYPVSNESPPDKINLFLYLVNLYKIKGSPQALLNVLRYYGLVDVDLYEGPGSGLGYTILKCEQYLQCPFIFCTNDTIVIEDIPKPDHNWIGYDEVYDNDLYRTFLEHAKKLYRERFKEHFGVE
jgi:hypothetical protein